MRAVPTGYVEILRGATTDDYGDPVDGDTVVGRVLASVLEQRVQPTTGADDRVQQVYTYTGRLPHGTDVQEGDRLRDTASGMIYVIDNISTVNNPVQRNDVRLDLRRAT